MHIHLKIFKKINDAIGLTKSESIVFWFLILAFAFGVAVKFLRGGHIPDVNTKLDYSAFDKEFEARSSEIEKSLRESRTLAIDSNPDISTNKININTATKEELMKLPGVGEKTAEQIIKHREIYGKFNRIEDLMNVKGIGQKKFEKLKNYITTY